MMEELRTGVMEQYGSGPGIGLIFSQGSTPGGKYLHWDDLLYRDPPEGLDHKAWWLGIKMSRAGRLVPTPLKDSQGQVVQFGVTDRAQEILHFVDKMAAGSIETPEELMNPETRDFYISKSVAEEAIRSSQLEGAATTRLVAKELLQTGRPPKGKAEQMIYNNYQAMLSIRDLKGQPLTPAMVLHLQEVLTIDTLKDPTASGRLRRADEDIIVSDRNSQATLHVPPPAEELDSRLIRLCAFANNETGLQFIHPVLRAILLHYWLAYDHLFVDGNGRTARALFYWSMASQGYWLCEFLSISRLLHAAPAKYGLAFLHSETDDNDATYFILHQLETLQKAIFDLHAYLERKTSEMAEARERLASNSKLSKALNHRQVALIQHAIRHSGYLYSIEQHRRIHGVAYQSARTDLLNLVELGLLIRQKSGRRFIFRTVENLEAKLRT
ncbi:Fic family protein [bacterium]|nr:Fic family protein [bacterium]